MCKVSVIVPVYNVEEYIDECLQSVLRQNLDDIEIICVDDCSTDGSRGILDMYKKKDKRIHITSYGKNGGLSYARNQGIENACGEYIFFLDADDVMAENALRELYCTAISENLDAIIFEMNNFCEDNSQSNDSMRASRIKKNYPIILDGQTIEKEMMLNKDWKPNVTTVLWKRSFLNKYSLRFHEGILHEDDPFTWCAFIFAKRVKVVRRAYYFRRVRAGSIMTKPTSMENVEGYLAGISDIIQTSMRYNSEMTDNGIMATILYLNSKEKVTRDMIMQIAEDRIDELHYQDYGMRLAYWKTLINGHKYTKGYLTKTEQATLRKEKDIIIYGFGSYGREIMILFEEYNIENYHVAITRKAQNTKSGLMEIVHELSDFYTIRESALVLIAVGNPLRDELRKEAEKQGFSRIVDFNEVM